MVKELLVQRLKKCKPVISVITNFFNHHCAIAGLTVSTCGLTGLCLKYNLDGHLSSICENVLHCFFYIAI